MQRRLRNNQQRSYAEQLSFSNEGESESESPKVKRRVARPKTKGKNAGESKVTAEDKQKTKTEKPKVGKKRVNENKEDGQVKRKKKLKEENVHEKEDIKLEYVSKTDSGEPAKKEEIDYTALLNVNGAQCTEWTDAEFISETNGVDRHIAENIVKLFKEDNTIPFIARYRKNMTNGMEADQLRFLKESFDQAKAIQHKAATIIKTIDKQGKWTPEIHSVIKSMKRLDDLEEIYALFKTGSKRSLAERAKELGLGSVSEAILQGKRVPSLSTFVNVEKEGLESEQLVRDGIIHIIADAIAKNKLVFEEVKRLRSTNFIEIQTSRSKKADASKADKKKSNEESKYEIYFNFKVSERNIKPHQTLAINRGESQNIINVKIVVPESLERAFQSYCLKLYRHAISASTLHASLIEESIGYAYKKFIKPLISRRVRNDIRKDAEVASINVFATNVKQLLLTPPVRGHVVLGVDPGFHHGCKLAVVSEHGNVLDTAVIYPHGTERSRQEARRTLIELATKHRAALIALGNATACRETEMFVGSLIGSKAFAPLDVSYAIVNEAGASIYSCSPEAKSEFPDLDPNLISAVSIARRLQDPLAELVKVEPKHLGVGMYQHDLPEKQLMLTLNEIVSEAVSFVGVDINTASLCLLKRVAGLNVARASNIIERRNERGPFRDREEILKVKGIGAKTYEQCAGFIRILPETAGSGERGKSRAKLNPLDRTWIHPESYKVARDFLARCGCDANDLGEATFIERVERFARAGNDVVARLLGTDPTTVDVIVGALRTRRDQDIRSTFDLPVFRNGTRSVDDLEIDAILGGVVRNVTDFGAFVDIGVGRDGLVPLRWCRNKTLVIGQRVEVKVRSVERDRNRIGLELITIS